jgi:hypothetical protein
MKAKVIAEFRYLMSASESPDSKKDRFARMTKGHEEKFDQSAMLLLFAMAGKRRSATVSCSHGI